MGVFIEVAVQSDNIASELSRNIVQLCPVDIFGIKDGSLIVRAENEDECTLCRLCLEAAPPGTIRIRKTYKVETLVSTGSAHEH